MRSNYSSRPPLLRPCPRPNIEAGIDFRLETVGAAVSRDYEPAKGQWYQNVEEDETFRVLSVDEDEELVEIEYLDGDIEEMDIDTWHEMDLEKIEEPEGWADKDDEEDEDEDEDLDEDDDDDDWDEDDDDDDDDLDDDEDDKDGY
jgi:hypothetical protein